jgi:hypothetical protein
MDHGRPTRLSNIQDMKGGQVSHFNKMGFTGGLVLLDLMDTKGLAIPVTWVGELPNHSDRQRPGKNPKGWKAR